LFLKKLFSFFGGFSFFAPRAFLSFLIPRAFFLLALFFPRALFNILFDTPCNLLALCL